MQCTSAGQLTGPRPEPFHQLQLLEQKGDKQNFAGQTSDTAQNYVEVTLLPRKAVCVISFCSRFKKKVNDLFWLANVFTLFSPRLPFASKNLDEEVTFLILPICGNTFLDFLD